MDLKTYQASTMAEAMAAVKQDLGRDAVILHTRSFRKGGMFGFGGQTMWEITASRSVNVPSRKPKPLRPMQVYSNVSKRGGNTVKAAAKKHAASNVTVLRGPSHIAENSRNVSNLPDYSPHSERDDKLTRQVEALASMVEKLVETHRKAIPQTGGGNNNTPQELFDTYLELIQRDVSEEIADELITRVRRQLTGDQLGDRQLVERKLKEFISSMIPTSITTVEKATGSPKVIALVGPTGVGKTTTIAKLAANIKLRQNRRVGLITIDTYRIAAVEQLRTYAQIINIPLVVVMSPDELASAISDMSDCDAILIDTAGRSPRDAERLKELKEFLAAANADETHLVLSTTANARNIEAAMEKFGPLGVDRLILTKLDEAVSFGMILGVIRRLKASLSFVTTGQDVPDDIEISEGTKLAELILGSQL